MADVDNPSLRRLTDVMLAVGKEMFPRGWVKDAVGWDDGTLWRVAWIVDPRKMEGMGVAQEDGNVPVGGQRAAWIVKQYGMSGQTFEYEREMPMGDFLERLHNELGDTIDWEEEFRVTLIPEPGYPWPAPDGYYSARKGAVLESPRPRWLLPENVVDTGRHIDSPGIDFCSLFPPEHVRNVGAEVVRYGKKPDDYFFVSHSMGTIEGMTRFGSVDGLAGWEENAQRVIDCGGLLFPSMAISPFPTANFGVASLIADAGLVINSLKPRLKGKDRSQATVYTSDAWTGRSGDFVTDSAVAAFEQMHGQSDYISYFDLNVWPLGAPKSLWTPGDMPDFVKSIAQLKRTLKQRFSIWTRGMTPEEVAEFMAENTDFAQRYPYLEAKVNGVLAISEFPMAAVARRQEEGYRRFLEMTGFAGELIVVDVPDEVADVMDVAWHPQGMEMEQRNSIQQWAWMEFGWNVADAIVDRAREIRL